MAVEEETWCDQYPGRYGFMTDPARAVGQGADGLTLAIATDGAIADLSFTEAERGTRFEGRYR